MRALLLLMVVAGLAAAVVPGGELVRFPPELPDAGGVAVAVRYGASPGELVLRLEPDPARPMAIAIPEGGISGGVSGPVVVPVGLGVAAQELRYEPATWPDARFGSTRPLTVTLALHRAGEVEADPVQLPLELGYTIPAEGLVVQRRLLLPVPAVWLPADE